MDSFATSVSYCLQLWRALKFLVDKFGHVRFEPSGWTGNQVIPYAKSIPDYIFPVAGSKFLGRNMRHERSRRIVALRPTEVSPQESRSFPAVATDAPMCAECGGMMTRNGSCYKCENCGGPAAAAKSRHVNVGPAFPPNATYFSPHRSCGAGLRPAAGLLPGSTATNVSESPNHPVALASTRSGNPNRRENLSDMGRFRRRVRPIERAVK